MKKNSDTMNVRYESPFLPSAGRRIWSRTARMPSSPMDCVRPGIILGLRNAAQKNAITASAQMIASSSGLVKPQEPIVNNGLNSKSCSPGAGYPHPLKICELLTVQFEGVAAARAPVTDHLPSGGSPACAACRTGR